MPRSEVSSDSFLQKYLGEASLIALVTAFSYFLAFCYQLGEALYWQFPISMIEVSLLQALTISFLLSFGSVTFGGLAFLLAYLLPKHTFYRVFMILFTTTLGAATLFMFREFLSVWFILVALAAILLFIILPEVYDRQLERRALEAGDTHQKRKTYLDQVAEYPNIRRVISFVIFLSFLPPPLVALGHYAGQSKKYFFVMDGSPEYVVLKMNSDVLVTALLDRESKRVEPTFILRRLDADAPMTLKREAVGPLTVVRNICPQRIPNKSGKELDCPTSKTVGQLLDDRH